MALCHWWTKVLVPAHVIYWDKHEQCPMVVYCGGPWCRDAEVLWLPAGWPYSGKETLGFLLVWRKFILNSNPNYNLNHSPTWTLLVTLNTIIHCRHLKEEDASLVNEDETKNKKKQGLASGILDIFTTYAEGCSNWSTHRLYLCSCLIYRHKQVMPDTYTPRSRRM